MIELQAFAKINLCLQVIGKREDGYHEIDSIMQSISLFDRIRLLVDEEIKVVSTNPQVPTDERNTARKAAEVFTEKTGIARGVRIELAKMIPVSAGLAGGSADAAAVLIGMNKMFGTKLSEAELMRLGEEVGSDVPFCIAGGTGRAQGRGELVSKLAALPKSWFVVVTPQLLVATMWVYQNFDRFWVKEERKVGEHKSIASIQMFNDLEKVVFWKHKQVEKLKQQLIQMGCLQALMTGSGPSVFGLVPNKKIGEQIFEEIRLTYPQSFLVENVKFGITILQNY
ncbi:4-(cytidine 5'-diphospho)-2-C-methyl-D-erythritol kinase [Candidatus Margulisiibacteriota bacterium]